MSPPAPVRLVVDHLVLDGVDLSRADVDVLVAALSAELGARVAERFASGWAAVPARLAAVPVPEVELAPGAPASELGRQLGAAVDAGLEGTPR